MVSEIILQIRTQASYGCCDVIRGYEGEIAHCVITLFWTLFIFLLFILAIKEIIRKS